MVEESISQEPALLACDFDTAPRERVEPLPSLTGIRGAAALWVLLFHANRGFNVTPGTGPALAVRGWSGIDLFFVLSGFILMHAHRADFAKLTAVGMGHYLRGRFLRVFPLTRKCATLNGAVLARVRFPPISDVCKLQPCHIASRTFDWFMLGRSQAAWLGFAVTERLFNGSNRAKTGAFFSDKPLK